MGSGTLLFCFHACSHSAHSLQHFESPTASAAFNCGLLFHWGGGILSCCAELAFSIWGVTRSEREINHSNETELHLLHSDQVFVYCTYRLIRRSGNSIDELLAGTPQAASHLCINRQVVKSEDFSQRSLVSCFFFFFFPLVQFSIIPRGMAGSDFQSVPSPRCR